VASELAVDRVGMASLNLQSAPCGIFLLDQDLVLLDANQTLCKLLGHEREAVLGKAIDDFLTPSFKLLFHLQTMTMLHANGRVEEIFLNLAGHQEREIPVLLNGVRLQDGNTTVFECVVMRVNERKRLEDDLFNIKKAVEQVPGMVFQYLRRADGSACFPYVSEVVRVICKLRPLQLTHSADPFHKQIHPDDWPAFLRSLEVSAQTRTVWHQEYRITLPGQGVRWLEAHAMPETRSNGDVLWHGHLHDITERRALQSALASEHERTRVTLRSIADAVITTDAQARVELLNAAAEQLTGWSQAQAEGTNIAQVLQVVDEHLAAQVDSAVRRCLIERVNIALPSKSVLLTRQGIPYAVDGSAAPILDATGGVSGAVMVFRNVTEQRRRQQAVEHRATHDHLTGLPNRAEFDRVLSQLFESAKTSSAVHALCCIDLDRFKQVNDAAGHAAGDQLLQRLASVLQSCVRTKDTVARIGGDEFALLLENCDLEAAKRVAELVCDKVRTLNFEFHGKVFHIGTSIGLATIDSHWARAQDVLAAADHACYAAKAAGKGCVKVAQA
jgi:diguanylate cyclase (GGDEF)-like protein/PAS domain S-box-containing protein